MAKTLQDMKKIFTLLSFTLIVALSGYSQALLTEPFNYTADPALGLGVQSASVWTRLNTGDSILIEDGSLSYPGFSASSGNKVKYGGAGSEYYRIFASQTSGTVYFSFLLNVPTISPMTTTGDYFISLIETGSTTNYYGRLWMRLSGTGYNVGINAASTAGNLAWSPTILNAGTTYLIVGSFQIVSGTGNDVSNIWVNPSSLGGAAPLADATSTNTGGNDPALGLQRVILRQGSAAYAGTLALDELRIGTTWADVTPAIASGPALFASGAITGLNTTLGTASPSQSFNLSGSDLTGAPGSITLNTSSNNFEVSTDNTTWDFSATVPYSSATLASTPIYVRLSEDVAAVGPVSGTVSIAGAGATTININVSGIATAPAPTTQASDVVISNILDNSFDVNWTNGNGAGRILVVRQTATTAVAPADGTIYTTPTSTGSGNAVWYSGTGTGPITVTGLSTGTNYTVQVYEYNGTAGNSKYNATAATNNPATASTTGISSTIQQGYFTAVAAPLYAGKSTYKLPTVYVATVSGLAPSTTYRYFGQAAAASDFGTTNTVAGTLILNDYTISTPSFYTASTGSLSAAGSYGKFTTDATGKFTGTFGFFSSSNTRFDSAKLIYPSLTIGLDTGVSAIKYRFALNQSITMLTFSSTGPNTASLIKGTSAALPNNVVALWKSEDGNSTVAARPLSMTLVENNGATSAMNALYDETNGSWNTLIPNDLANGVRLIQQFNVDGSVVGCNADADGVWGGTNTVNPSTGIITPLQINSADAPLSGGVCYSILPIRLGTFAVQKTGNNASIFWTTEQEINSKEFVIERATNGGTFTSIASVRAAGNSAGKLSYSFTDIAPIKGVQLYRLRLIDFDGKFSNSATKSVFFGNADVVLVTPNPATTFVNIYMGKNNNNLSQIIVTSANGKMIEKINTADQTYQLQTSNYAKGLYFISVVSEGNSSTQKVIIQ